MALTLPYPSMNFVPLDVLTAAEQNQLVANIEYIANQFPITSQNIDWTTLTSSSTNISSYSVMQTGTVWRATIDKNANLAVCNISITFSAINASTVRLFSGIPSSLCPVSGRNVGVLASTGAMQGLPRCYINSSGAIEAVFDSNFGGGSVYISGAYFTK